MRQHGVRNDPAHLNAYAAAEFLIAPFPKELEDEITPDHIREKTFYSGAFSTAAESEISESEARAKLSLPFRDHIVLLMTGQGGSKAEVNYFTKLAELYPQIHWVCIGSKMSRSSDETTADNLHLRGWVSNPEEFVAAADTVVSSAGHNSVMQIGAAGKPFIAIAESRPFDEQLRKAIILDREGLAVALDDWPDPADFGSLLERAQELDTGRWKKLFTGDGAQEIARCLEDSAREYELIHSKLIRTHLGRIR